MSDDELARGYAWGRDHKWRNLGTEHRATLWQCEACKASFLHHYPRQPIIGLAAREEGIPEHCAAIAAEERKP